MARILMGRRFLRRAWAKVLTIRDISQVTAGTVPESAEQLYEVWSADYDQLGSDTEAKDRVLSALEQVRMDTHEVLNNLE